MTEFYSSKQPLRGMYDLLPEEYTIHDYIIKESLSIANVYNYQQISTPILEYTAVFDRTLGITSDVVSKEIYNFKDKNSKNICLRPEFTAGIVRSIISNKLLQKIPIRYFTTGPIFRYDRPQAGRNRQFHQINFEHIGYNNLYFDAELIKLASNILNKLNILCDTSLEINSLGFNGARDKYKIILEEYFMKYYFDLSAYSQNKIKKNPIRILDSKNPQDEEIIANAPTIEKCYDQEEIVYFEQIKKYLDLLDVNYKVNPYLVRGLDYYSHVIFEFITTKLGTQNTIIAGGRYDKLIEIMGYKSIPSIGFAGGVERIAMILNENSLNTTTKDTCPIAYLICIENEAFDHTILLLEMLRSKNIRALIGTKSHINDNLSEAYKKKCKYAIFVGENEKNTNSYSLRILSNNQQKNVQYQELISIISSHCEQG
ncbi:histidine--tRNA ligase [Rickettsia endosymbiont of Cardiosporidium cionae]|uniref:histidine--tRNA ligase n=1 Tax=Rickettsia endosymbiont of Cardiosporidium cionae TaxID=2777155 RepID=UPI001895D348|nr:histidine--tRNA ligase [Rickettsia endosymbiont of Cardiosporidium cionae]KAF8818451.1 histidine--tRNA ligase [Rickettsia endosymbiont of Cardiosporidium cionae]